MNFEVLNLQMFRSGGNGDLYLGQRSDTGEWVVVKFLREYHLAHCRKAFAREVRVLLRKSRGLPGLYRMRTVVRHHASRALRRDFGRRLQESGVVPAAN